MPIVDFSAFQGALSRPLRWLIHRIPDSTVLPVLQGPLRGARWISGASDAGCWLGSYDTATQGLLARRVPRGGVVYDIGANVGFFTLLAARLAGPEGAVYAFEPLPANLDVLRRHLELNRCANVTVVAAAASDRDGRACFEGAGSTGRLSAELEDGGFEVATVRLDSLVARGELKVPAIVKLDVEGAELAVLQGMENLLVTARPTLLIEFHGRWMGGVDVDTRCRELLKDAGYSLTRVDRVVLAEPS